MLLPGQQHPARYCNLRFHSSRWKAAASNPAEAAQFSRILRSNRLSHVLGSGGGGGGGGEFNKELDEMLDKIATMPDPSQGYGFVLKKIAERKALEQGKRVHAHILRNKWDSNVFVSNLLVQMYSKCGSMDLARIVFGSTINRNEHSWNTIIAGYVHNGSYKEALELFHNMECEKTVRPNGFVFASALAACSHLGDLDQGRKIHEKIRASKVGAHDIVIGNALVTMYAKCGDLETGRRLFEEMHEKNLVSWNAIISAYVQGGQPREALEIFARMRAKPNSFIFASALTACSMVADLDLGKKLHERFVESGLKPDLIVQNALMSMYAKCGELDEAMKVFRDMPRRDVCAWTSLISGYAQHGHSERALELLAWMKDEKVQPNAVTFSTLIAACPTLEQGELVKSYAFTCGYESDPIVQTAVLGMYGKNGEIEKASRIFESIRDRDKDVVAWSSMLSAYAQHGFQVDALRLFWRMVSQGVEPNVVTFTSIISSCGSGETLDQVKAVHARLMTCSCKHDSTVRNALVRMYCRVGSLEDAREAFDETELKDLRTWTSLITAYVQHGQSEKALELYREMDCDPDEFVLASVAAACASFGSLEEGVRVLSRARSLHLLTCDVLGTSLLDMFVKCKSLDEASKLFSELQSHNVYAWTVMVGGFAQAGNSAQALKLFRTMELEGIKPNVVTFASALPALSSPKALGTGRHWHSRLVAMGEDSDCVVVTVLIAMYCKCGSLREARDLFEKRQPQEQLFTWNALMCGYNHHGFPEEALDLYKRLVATEAVVKPNGHTFTMALNACSSLGDLEQGKKIHELVEKCEIQAEYTLNALITMYSRCGWLDKAREVFDRITSKSVVSWTAMISTYLHSGLAREALELYHRMDAAPDDVTYACVLNACATLGDLVQGRAIHARATSSDAIASDYVKTAVANMYAKCGAMTDAREIFDKVLLKDTVSWNTMITAYAQHGNQIQVLELYREMALSGAKADGITFLAILGSCGHAGKAKEAICYSRFMVSEHGLCFTPEHLQCVTDLLARAGHLADAEEFITDRKAPEKNSVAWLTLLSACRDHGDADRGQRAALHVFELDPVDTAPYILLSNLYASRADEEHDGHVQTTRETCSSR